jgi:hypothetical protein
MTVFAAIQCDSGCSAGAGFVADKRSPELHAQVARGNTDAVAADAAAVLPDASRPGAGKKRPLLIVKTGELVASGDQNTDPATAGALFTAIPQPTNP